MGGPEGDTGTPLGSEIRMRRIHDFMLDRATVACKAAAAELAKSPGYECPITTHFARPPLAEDQRRMHLERTECAAEG